MNVYQEKTIGEWVAEDYRSASVFKSFGIDFCCKGGRSIQEACESKNISEREVEIALAEAVMDKPEQGDIDFKSWPMDLLADYIEKTHHRYVEKAIEELKPYLTKVCKVHGDSNPELHTVKQLFFESAGELTAHMKKEEFTLFPHVRKLEKHMNDGSNVEAPHFGTVKNPIKMMMDEHEAEGDRFEEIARLTNNYTPPEHACNTYRVTFALLEEFQNDLHRHIHLENNILFPKAVRVEESFNALN
jgi:regulator of cell morphogenesis and NO signaling